MVTEKLVKALREGVCEINFTKTDNTIRILKGTLNENNIPSDKIPLSVEIHPQGGFLKPREKPSKNPSIQKVFDVVKNEWRSFRLDRVNSWKKINE